MAMPVVHRKQLKAFALEFVQWCAFACPVFVTSGELARVLHDHRGASYWIVVAVSIAYVTGCTLVVWLPVKVLFQWMKKIRFHNDKWCQPTFLFVFFSFLPSTIMILYGSEIAYYQTIYFESSCVEVILIMLLLTGYCEKLKKYKLRETSQQQLAEARGTEIPGSQSNHRNEMENSYNFRRESQAPIARTLTSRDGVFSYLSWTDHRPTELAEDMLEIYDIRTLLILASKTTSEWMYPIYIFGFFASASLIFTRRSRYRNLATTALLDLPFFCIRLGCFCQFGHVTSILFLCKNFFACASRVYFDVVVERVIDGGAHAVLERTDDDVAYGNNVDRRQLPTAGDRGYSYSMNDFDDDDDQHHHHHPGGDDVVRTDGDCYDRYDDDGGGGVEQRLPPPSNKRSRQKINSDLYRQIDNDAVASGHGANEGAAATPESETYPYATYASAVRKDDGDRHQQQIATARNDDHPFPPPPPPPEASSSSDDDDDQAGDPTTVDVQVGPHRVSVRRDAQYTPQIAAEIADEALAAIADDVVGQLASAADEYADSAASSSPRPESPTAEERF